MYACTGMGAVWSKTPDGESGRIRWHRKGGWDIRGRMQRVELWAGKLLFLVLRNIGKEWTMPPREWEPAMNQFAVLFATPLYGPGRV